jgi:hypothetical protein
MTIEIRVRDIKTKEILKPVYKTKQTARRAAHRLDNVYGAHRYQAVLFNTETKEFSFA